MDSVTLILQALDLIDEVIEQEEMDGDPNDIAGCLRKPYRQIKLIYSDLVG